MTVSTRVSTSTSTTDLGSLKCGPPSLKEAWSPRPDVHDVQIYPEV
jgi:hypothetical protein